MNTAEKPDNSLMAGGEPHQKEEMDQAESASRPYFTLAPEKGLTPDPDQFNHGDPQDNIKQTDQSNEQHDDLAAAGGFDSVSEVNLDEDENSVTRDDLQALNGLDQDEESTL